MSDTHLGYEYTDPIRGMDSFAAFQECLNIAKNERVDCILHAGDMFDRATPPRVVFVKTMEILRGAILGEMQSQIVVESYEGLTQEPNVMDDNLRVSIPFFAICGNHDPPTGHGMTSANDLLSTVRYVNVFERTEIGDDCLQLKPVIIAKGQLTVCIYGLGYMSDGKFVEALRKESIEFVKPEEDGRKREYIMMVHQNRVQREPYKNQVEKLLHNVCPWMNLVIWGHEHESKIDIERVGELNITQPGSTIPTQLRDGEAGPRHMAVLNISESESVPASLHPYALSKPRKFVFENLSLDLKRDGLMTSDKIRTLLREKLEAIITDATVEPVESNENTDRGEVKMNRPMLPLVYLNVTSESVDMTGFSRSELMHEFRDRVANPDNIIHIKDKSKGRRREPEMETIASRVGDVETLLNNRFRDSPMSVLDPFKISTMLRSFVDDQDSEKSEKNKAGFQGIHTYIDSLVSDMVLQAPPNGCTTEEEARNFVSNLQVEAASAEDPPHEQPTLNVAPEPTRVDAKRAAHEVSIRLERKLPKRKKSTVPEKEQEPKAVVSSPTKKKPPKTVLVNIDGTQYPAIRRCSGLMGFRITESTTKNLLFWCDNNVSVDYCLGLEPWQFVNHFPGTFSISRKIELSRTYDRAHRLFPQLYNFHPLSFALPAQALDLKRYMQSASLKRRTFIIKPDLGAQGKGISLIMDPFDAEICCESAIAQQYISPMLLDGLKFDFRIYALVTSIQPLRVYMLDEGMTRFCTEQYKKPRPTNLGDVFRHLTNYSVNKKNDKFEKTGDSDSGHKRSQSSVFAELESLGHDTKTLKAKIDRIVMLTILAGQPFIAHNYKASVKATDGKSRCFEILGFDVMFDKKMKPWLLEVNHSPSLRRESPFDKELKNELIVGAMTILDLNPSFRKQTMTREKARTAQRLAGGPDMRVRKPVWSAERESEIAATQTRWRQLFPVVNDPPLTEIYDNVISGLLTLPLDGTTETTLSQRRREASRREPPAEQLMKISPKPLSPKAPCLVLRSPQAQLVAQGMKLMKIAKRQQSGRPRERRLSKPDERAMRRVMPRRLPDTDDEAGPKRVVLEFDG